MRRSNRISAESGSGDSTRSPGRALPRAGDSRSTTREKFCFALSRSAKGIPVSAAGTSSGGRGLIGGRLSDKAVDPEIQNSMCDRETKRETILELHDRH